MPFLRRLHPASCAAFALVFFCLATTASANAAEDSKPVRIKLRVTPPFHRLLGTNPWSAGGGLPMVGLIGGSLGVEYRELWTAELGRAWLGHTFAMVDDTFARVGVVPVLVDIRKANGAGWTTQLDVLAGYRYLEIERESDGVHASETTHALLANLGAEFTYHMDQTRQTGLPLPSGFLMRILSGVTLPLSQRYGRSWDFIASNEPDVELRWALDLAFDIGVAW